MAAAQKECPVCKTRLNSQLNFVEDYQQLSIKGYRGKPTGTLCPLWCPLILSMKIAILFNSQALCSSSFLRIVMLLLFIVTFLNSSVSDDYDCSCDRRKYASGSKFESDLNTVLNNLVQHTSSSGGFNTSDSGQSPNKIYGLLQCRGDISVEECYICSVEARATILQECPNAVGSSVWRDKCFLRYQKYSFIGVLDQHSTCGYDMAKDPLPIDMAIRNLSKSLLNDAFSSPKKYAVNTTVDSWTKEKIQGLVQCWMDISTEDCHKCLLNATSNFLSRTTGTLVGGMCYSGSCVVRFESASTTASRRLPPPQPSIEAPTDSAPPRLPPPQPSIEAPALPQPPPSSKSSKRVALILGNLGGLLLTFLVGLFATRRKIKSALLGKPVLPRDLHKGNQYIDEDSLMIDQRILFNIETLAAATRNFHHDNELGKGGFGTVYKGTMPNGREIAVKKLSPKSTQGNEEFLNEVKLTAKIQHRHLVNLLGCCIEESERMLVYEYLPNRSLDKILFDSQLSKQLDWQKRFAIIIGIARGLLYLHEDSQPRIIHRDIKASNILLDGKMNPKIADFGLARLFPEDETHVNTRVAGTYGYMAPEYAMQGQLSVKADVYSFGVVLLEIVCGRKNTDFNFSTEFQSLLELVWTSYSRGNIVEIIDRAIVESCTKDEALRCIHVRLLCTQADASLRPSMSSVNSMFLNASITKLRDPTMPAFVKVTRNELPSPVEGSTINNASITTLVGR